ncbi:MAG: hypothetical protein AAF702_21810 [Chloroflexota bacterium]
MKGTKQVLQAYFVWILVGGLSGWTVWMLHSVGIYLVSIWVQSPWRLFGWTSESVQPYSRFSIFILGSAWLIYVLYLENRLQLHARESRLWSYAGRVTVALGLILLICLALLSLSNRVG